MPPAAERERKRYKQNKGEITLHTRSEPKVRILLQPPIDAMAHTHSYIVVVNCALPTHAGHAVGVHAAKRGRGRAAHGCSSREDTTREDTGKRGQGNS